MSKKVFIVVCTILVIIIALLVYCIYITRPTEDYITLPGTKKTFFDLSDNGNEIVFTMYNSDGKIYSESIYTFENDLLTKLTRVEHCDSIAQAKIDKKYPTDTTASKCYRDKNKLIYTYDNYDLYGSSKDEILQILNNIIESVESTENRNS